jgi:hypothetical protein
MGWLKKAKDPLTERERALREEIERLETQIRTLGSRSVPSRPASGEPAPQPHPTPASAPARVGRQEAAQPRLRSTALPGGQAANKPAGPEPAKPSEQVFERIDHKRLQTPPDTATKGLYNELGVRKYDLPEAWQRLRAFFRGSTAQNQTLVKLLAAGNIQGLRPLRYEKRVARRRFIIFVVVLFLLLWGIIAMFLRR